MIIAKSTVKRTSVCGNAFVGSFIIFMGWLIIGFSADLDFIEFLLEIYPAQKLFIAIFAEKIGTKAFVFTFPFCDTLCLLAAMLTDKFEFAFVNFG